MESLFNKLYNEVIQNDELNTETCCICHYKIKENEELIKLKCSHFYHKNCLIQNTGNCSYCNKKYKITDKDIIIVGNKCNTIIKSTKQICGRIKCNYHNKKSNQNTPKIEQPSSESIFNTCNVILKSGINKGKECGRINCKYHNHNIIVKFIRNPF